jgi:hypothetical protein
MELRFPFLGTPAFDLVDDHHRHRRRGTLFRGSGRAPRYQGGTSAIRCLEGYRREGAVEKTGGREECSPEGEHSQGRPSGVFNIKGNDYRLITLVQYVNGVLMIRFFGSHEDYDEVDAETV